MDNLSISMEKLTGLVGTVTQVVIDHESRLKRLEGEST